MIISRIQNTSHLSSNHTCMGLTKQFVFQSKGQSSDQHYDDDILSGFDWLCRNAIRNISSELTRQSNPDSEFLIQQKGFVPIDENDIRKGYFILKCNERRGDITIDLYNYFSFHIYDCQYKMNDDILCNCCQKIAKAFRRKCATKGRFERSDVADGRGQRISHAISSPSKAERRIKAQSRTIHRLQCSQAYYKNRYSELLSNSGMFISPASSDRLFNSETKNLYEKFLDENTDAVPQKELIRYLCAKSWDNSEKARRHGKRNVLVSF